MHPCGNRHPLLNQPVACRSPGGSRKASGWLPEPTATQDPLAESAHRRQMQVIIAAPDSSVPVSSPDIKKGCKNLSGREAKSPVSGPAGPHETGDIPLV